MKIRAGWYMPIIPLTISTDQYNYNIFTNAGSPGSICSVTLTVNTGVVVTQLIDSAAGGWAVGSTLLIVNNGHIDGVGGNGGDGGAGSGGAGTGGSNGGRAIDTNHVNLAVSINNTNGYIFGGGGGGAGGAGNSSNYGGGGGGGRGSGLGGYKGGTTGGGTQATVGGDASFSAAGVHGTGSVYLGFGGEDGADGGDWGAFGGDAPAYFGAPLRSGGGPGYAVYAYTGTLSWLGGNNGSQVKGSVRS